MSAAGRTFSRWMPAYQDPGAAPLSRAAMAILLALAAGALWYLARHPVGILVGGVFVSLVWLHGRVNDRRLARRAAARTGEDIGSFARAFDRRAPTFDPRVVRAVWDALAPWTVLRDGSRFPLRPSDAIEELGCVAEDFDDVYVEAATRAGRERALQPTNPYGGRVVTVGDLVACITHQPRAAAS